MKLSEILNRLFDLILCLGEEVRVTIEILSKKLGVTRRLWFYLPNGLCPCSQQVTLAPH